MNRLAARAVKRSLARLRGLDHFNCLDQDDPVWQERARDAVSLCRRHIRIAHPERELVFADLGCGNRRVERLLHAAFSTPIVYRGYDLHPQSRQTTPIDLQRELPPGHVDVALTLGVLEYLDDIAGFFGRMSHYADRYVLSYMIVDSPEPLSTAQRERVGWRSHYTSSQIEAMLADAGYVIEEATRTIRGTTGLWLARATGE